jgi:hypothetical protein
VEGLFTSRTCTKIPKGNSGVGNNVNVTHTVGSILAVMFVGFSPLIQNCSQHFPRERRYRVFEVQAGQGEKGLTELVSREFHIVGKIDWLTIDNHAADVITPLVTYADVEMMHLDTSTSRLCDNSGGLYRSIVRMSILAHEAEKVLQRICP